VQKVLPKVSSKFWQNISWKPVAKYESLIHSITCTRKQNYPIERKGKKYGSQKLRSDHARKKWFITLTTGLTPWKKRRNHLVYTFLVRPLSKSRNTKSLTAKKISLTKIHHHYERRDFQSGQISKEWVWMLQVASNSVLLHVPYEQIHQTCNEYQHHRVLFSLSSFN